MKKTGELGSIHYDERFICDLWTDLADFADVTSGTFTVEYDSGSTTFEEPEELENATHIPDRITNFELSLSATDGDLRITANPAGHIYTVEGEEDWVRKVADYIRDFSSERKNSIRTILSDSRIRDIQFATLGGLIAVSFNQLIAIILPFYYRDFPRSRLYASIILMIAIVFFQLSKYVYPSVEFRRRGSQTRVRKAAFAFSMVGATAGILQSIIFVFNLI